MTDQMQVDIVSPEGSLFSGKVTGLFLKSTEGDLGIMPGHLQLLTQIAPCSLRMTHLAGELDNSEAETLLFVSGGILEVQPNSATLLADTALRPQDVNESAAQQAKEEAQKILEHHKMGTRDFQAAQADLMDAMARLQVIELMRLKKRH